MTKSIAVSPLTMPAALAAADDLLGRQTWLGNPDDPDQVAWLESFRRRAELAAGMPEVHRHATDSAAKHVAWLKSEGWEAQITHGTPNDLFLASTLCIVAKWQEVGRAYKEGAVDRVLLKKGARVSAGVDHLVVEVATQNPRFSFCFHQVRTAPTSTAELAVLAVDVAARSVRETVHLDFPMVDLTVRDDAKYMIGLRSGENVVAQAAEQLRLELNEVGGRASAAAEVRMLRSASMTRTVKIDGPFVVVVKCNDVTKTDDQVAFAAYVDRDAWRKPAEGRI